MADPLSISTGVLAVVTAVMQSSKKLVAITKDIKTGSEEIRAIFREVQSLHQIICLLQAALKAIERERVNIGEDFILEMLPAVMNPLSNCEIVLVEIAKKLQKILKYGSKATGERTGVIGLRWALYVKSDVKDLQIRLEAEKTTLSTALSGIAA